MTTLEARAQLVTDLLGRLRTAWPGNAWEWDGRFGCALSTVSKAQEPAAREALAAALPAAWTETTLSEAPAAVRELCDGVGGLRGSQLVLAAELGDGVFLFCLWWPWGSGANISARLGATDPEDLSASLRSALGIR